MNKSWMIVAGACGLVGLVLVTKHVRSPNAPEASAPKTLEALASTPRAQHSGWLASEDKGGMQAAGGAARSQEFPDGGRGAIGEPGTGRESLPDRGARDPGARIGAGRVWGGSGSGASGAGPSAGYSGSDPIRAQTNVSPAETGPLVGAGQSLRDTHGQPNGPGTGPQELVKKTDNPANAAPGDPNGPVLDIPLDKTTDTGTGPAPTLNENVACEGVGEGCVFDANSQLAIPDSGNLSGEEGSISFCLQPQWTGADPGNAGLLDLQAPNTWSNRMKIFKNGPFLRFSLWPDSGFESGASARISNWQSGQWHPVTVTFGTDPQTGQNMASMYVDGSLAGQQTYQGPIQIPQGQPLYIGSDYPGGEPAAAGALKNFQAYNRVLAPDEAANFAAGCPQ